MLEIGYVLLLLLQPRSSGMLAEDNKADDEMEMSWLYVILIPHYRTEFAKFEAIHSQDC